MTGIREKFSSGKSSIPADGSRTRPFTLIVLSVLCFALILAAGCDAPWPVDMTIHVMKLDETGVSEWNTTFPIVSGYSDDPGPVLLSSDGSLYLVNEVVNNTHHRDIPPSDRHLAGYAIRKIDKDGHDVWDHLFPFGVDDPYLLIENPDTSITVWCDDCNQFTIDSNGTFLRKDFWNNRLCSAPPRINPHMMTESSPKVLEYMNKTRGESNPYRLWIVNGGYIYIDQSASTPNALIITLTSFDDNGEFRSVQTARWDAYTRVGYNTVVSGIGTVLRTPDGGTIVVAYKPTGY